MGFDEGTDGAIFSKMLKILSVVIQRKTLDNIYNGMGYNFLPALQTSEIGYDDGSMCFHDAMGLSKYPVSVFTGLCMEHQGHDAAVKLVVIKTGCPAVSNMVHNLWRALLPATDIM